MRISTSLITGLAAAASLTTASPSVPRNQDTNSSPLPRVGISESLMDPVYQEPASNSSRVTDPIDPQIQAEEDAIDAELKSGHMLVICLANAKHFLMRGQMTAEQARDYSRDCLHIVALTETTNAKYSLNGQFPTDPEQIKEITEEFCGKRKGVCDGKETTPFCAGLTQACKNRGHE